MNSGLCGLIGALSDMVGTANDSASVSSQFLVIIDSRARGCGSVIVILDVNQAQGFGFPRKPDLHQLSNFASPKNPSEIKQQHGLVFSVVATV